MRGYVKFILNRCIKVIATPAPRLPAAVGGGKGRGTFSRETATARTDTLGMPFTIIQPCRSRFRTDACASSDGQRKGTARRKGACAAFVAVRLVPSFSGVTPRGARTI